MASVTEKSNPVPLIIFIVLFVFASVALVLVATEHAKLRNYVEQGFRPGAEDHRLDLVSAGLKSRYQALNTQYQQSLDELQQYKQIVGVVKVDKLQAEIKEFANRIATIQGGGGDPAMLEAQNLMELLHVLEKEKILLGDQLRKAGEDFKKQKENLQAEVEIERRSSQEAQARAQQKSTELDELKVAHEKNLEEKAALLKTLETRADRERAERGTEVARLNEEKIQLNAEKENYRLLYEELLSKETKREGSFEKQPDFVEPADGRVIKVDKDAGVIIDIGQRKGVRRGFRFQVYYEKPDGSRITRGEIEIKTVFPDISRGILMSGEDPSDVIHEGDIIINLAFDPGRAKIFVADDVFDDAKLQSFKQMLSEYGSVLEEELSPRTNYLIISNHSGKRRDLAVKQGVVLILDTELRRYLGR